MVSPWIRDTLGKPEDWAQSFAVATAVGAGLALLGPFGTYVNSGLDVRLAYWVGLLWVGVALYGPAVRFAIALGPRTGVPIWFSLAVAAIVASIPMAALARGTAMTIWRPYVASMSVLAWYGQCLIVSVPVVLAQAALVQRRGGFGNPLAPPDVAQTGDEDSVRVDLRRPDPASSPATFLDRLPPKLGRELLCLQMEDHYVRAHTLAGAGLILIPLHQAIAELQGLEGLRVHRSWWVARGAVEAVERDGRSLRLRLKAGLRAPVARRAVADLKAAGWIV